MLLLSYVENNDKRENEKNEYCESCMYIMSENSILQHEDTEWLDPLAVFTTSPEYIYGVSHIALPTKHRLNDKKYHKASTVPNLLLYTGQMIGKCNIRAIIPSTKNAMQWGQ